jgi:hypothetical protein
MLVTIVLRLENKLTVCKKAMQFFLALNDCDQLSSKKILHGSNVKAGNVFV